MDMTLHGIAASGGIGIGKAVCVREPSLDYSGVAFGGADKEKERLQAAVDAFCAATQDMADNLKARVGEKEAEILSGQITMLQDPFMLSQMKESIDGGQCAEAALDTVCTMYADMFAGMDDELMRQRATDIRDIRTRMLQILLNRQPVDLAALPAGSVLVAHDLTPSMTVGLQKENVAAILTETGGRTSHSAILARSLELPAVLSVPGALEQVADGQILIVDGDEGCALLSPGADQLAAYEAKREACLEKRRMLEKFRGKPTLDGDGRVFKLYANIGSAEDAAAAAAASAEGIGLFRTEFLFMDRAALPTEEEQYAVYKEVADSMAGREVIIRTLDVGGDKDIPYLGLEKEDNPFLGHRAIRFCLDRPDIFKVQLRALLRAGASHGNIRIMLPLITGLDEVRAAKELLAQCKAELDTEGIAYDKDISVGIMVETAAASVLSDVLAAEADFFSIGTNDLIQYTLEVDRGNAKVGKLYTPYHPAVLRSIRRIIESAKAVGIPVGMCGEAAADPLMIPLLLAFGLDEFSVSPAAVLATRARIASWTRADAVRTAAEAMLLPTAADIEKYLQAACAER